MGADTKIEWADHTFNPWVGCAKVSPACTNCYAESWAKRAGHADLWRGVRSRTSAANWRLPLKWNRTTPGARVFCASLADVFEDHPDLAEWRLDLFRLIHETPRLIWMLLTKRPEKAASFFRLHGGRAPDNVWVGTTVENQEQADRRIPELLTIHARVRFLSCEPLLGPVDLGGLRERDLQWVIAGGESGPKARPSHPNWFRSLRDECAQATIPFHFKQWGEHDEHMLRVGKARAGRLLDGQEHNGVAVPRG